MDTTVIQVNAGQEVAEIARDFERPEEVLREAVHNCYDAGARETRIKAWRCFMRPWRRRRGSNSW